MLAAAETGGFFTKDIGEEFLTEVEEDFLIIPRDSDQGVHALQEMLANSILHENSNRHISTDLNLGLRALENPSLRMADLFSEDSSTEHSNITNDLEFEVESNIDHKYRPMPFLDKGMLSFYMHVDDNDSSVPSFPMSELIQEEELTLVPIGAVLH
ncbi:hypothetical protein [Kiloniella antarctica]|uniref:Glycosyl transferase family 1 domain-containing protein n=1 Tax=Kiloniella antarctica TaxID=1550907 RepID=A0ABW5BS55_9PROT